MWLTYHVAYAMQSLCGAHCQAHSFARNHQLGMLHESRNASEKQHCQMLLNMMFSGQLCRCNSPLALLPTPYFRLKNYAFSFLCLLRANMDLNEEDTTYRGCETLALHRLPLIDTSDSLPYPASEHQALPRVR